MQFHQILVGITAVVALLGASLLGHSYFLSPTLKITNKDSHCSLRAFERNLANYKTVTFKPIEGHHMLDNLAMALATTTMCILLLHYNLLPIPLRTLWRCCPFS